jgi:hypothetical protein
MTKFVVNKYTDYTLISPFLAENMFLGYLF